MAAATRRLGAFDVRQRIGRSRVLRETLIVVIRLARVRIEDHILQHAAEADGVPYARLALAREANRLGVAAALDVENAVPRPAVLVIADQAPLAVGRQRRFAGAGQTEKQRGVAGRAEVGRAVHGEDAAQWQEIIENGKDRFLDFASIISAADQYQAMRQMQDDEGVAACAVEDRVGVHAAGAQDGQPFLVDGVRSRLAVAQQRLSEQSVPGFIGNDTHRQSMFGIGAGAGVTDEQVASLQVGQRAMQQALENLRLHRSIDRPPTDIVLRQRLGDDKTILRRPAGMRPGVGDQRPVGGQHALAARQRQLDPCRRRQLVAHRAGVSDAVPAQVEVRSRAAR